MNQTKHLVTKEIYVRKKISQLLRHFVSFLEMFPCEINLLYGMTIYYTGLRLALNKAECRATTDCNKTDEWVTRTHTPVIPFRK